MKTIVYYYTLTGHCEGLSGKIAEQLECERERIIEKKKRIKKGFLRFLSGRSAMQKEAAAIEPVSKEPGLYDRIVVVTPFWADSPTPAVRGFLDRYHHAFEGKKLGLVITNLGTDPAKAFARYQELFPEPLITRSFTRAKGEWEDPKEAEGIRAFIAAFNA